MAGGAQTKASDPFAELQQACKALKAVKVDSVNDLDRLDGLIEAWPPVLRAIQAGDDDDLCRVALPSLGLACKGPLARLMFAAEAPGLVFQPVVSFLRFLVAEIPKLYGPPGKQWRDSSMGLLKGEAYVKVMHQLFIEVLIYIDTADDSDDPTFPVRVRNVIAQTLMEPICVMLKDERVTSRFPLVLLRDMTEILSESISQHNKNRAKVVSLIEPRELMNIVYSGRDHDFAWQCFGLVYRCSRIKSSPAEHRVFFETAFNGRDNAVAVISRLLSIPRSKWMDEGRNAFALVHAGRTDKSQEFKALTLKVNSVNQRIRDHQLGASDDFDGWFHVNLDSITAYVLDEKEQQVCLEWDRRDVQLVTLTAEGERVAVVFDLTRPPHVALAPYNPLETNYIELHILSADVAHLKTVLRARNISMQDNNEPPRPKSSQTPQDLTMLDEPHTPPKSPRPAPLNHAEKVKNLPQLQSDVGSRSGTGTSERSHESLPPAGQSVPRPRSSSLSSVDDGVPADAKKSPARSGPPSASKRTYGSHKKKIVPSAIVAAEDDGSETDYDDSPPPKPAAKLSSKSRKSAPTSSKAGSTKVPSGTQDKPPEAEWTGAASVTKKAKAKAKATQAAPKQREKMLPKRGARSKTPVIEADLSDEEEQITPARSVKAAMTGTRQQRRPDTSIEDSSAIEALEPAPLARKPDATMSERIRHNDKTQRQAMPDRSAHRQPDIASVHTRAVDQPDGGYEMEVDFDDVIRPDAFAPSDTAEQQATRSPPFADKTSRGTSAPTKRALSRSPSVELMPVDLRHASAPIASAALQAIVPPKVIVTPPSKDPSPTAAPALPPPAINIEPPEPSKALDALTPLHVPSAPIRVTPQFSLEPEARTPAPATLFRETTPDPPRCLPNPVTIAPPPPHSTRTPVDLQDPVARPQQPLSVPATPPATAAETDAGTMQSDAKARAATMRLKRVRELGGMDEDSTSATDDSSDDEADSKVRAEAFFSMLMEAMRGKKRRKGAKKRDAKRRKRETKAAMSETEIEQAVMQVEPRSTRDLILSEDEDIEAPLPAPRGTAPTLTIQVSEPRHSVEGPNKKARFSDPGPPRFADKLPLRGSRLSDPTSGTRNAPDAGLSTKRPSGNLVTSAEANYDARLAPYRESLDKVNGVLMANAHAKLKRMGKIRAAAVEDIHLRGHTILDETRDLVSQAAVSLEHASEVRLEVARRRVESATEVATTLREAHAAFKAYMRPIEERQTPDRWKNAIADIIKKSREPINVEA